MPIQSATEVDVRLGLENVWGEVPAVPALQTLEKVSWSVSLKKESYVSNRMRADRQVAYMRHGVRSADGDLTDELSLGAHDRLLAAAFAGEWTAGAVVNATMSASGVTFTRTAGSFVNDGILPGDVVIVANYVAPQNNGRFNVIAVTATTVTVDRPLTTEADTLASISVIGFKLKSGKTKYSFFAEVSKPDIDGDNFEIYTGLRIGSASISLPPTGLATVRYTFMGKDMKLSDSELDNTVEAATAGDLLSSVNGTCLIDGVEAALLTALDLNIDNGLSGEAVVGRNTKPTLIYGRSKVTGSFSAMLDSNRFLKAFDDESEISLDLRLDGEDALATPFLRLMIPRAKLSSCESSVQGEGAVMVQCNFQALLDPAHGAAIIAQKSNA